MKNLSFGVHKKLKKDCRFRYKQDVELSKEKYGDIELPKEFITLDFCKLNFKGCSFLNCPYLKEGS